MSHQTKNSQGESITWLNVQESAEYIQRSVGAFRTALRRYTEKTGKTINSIENGNEKLYLQTDLDDLLRELYPFIAQQKGL